METKSGEANARPARTSLAEKAWTAIRAATQRLLEDRGVKLNLAEGYIRDKPLVSTAIAAASGFVVGGGLTTRPGVALFFLLSRRMVSEIASNLVLGAIRTSQQVKSG